MKTIQLFSVIGICLLALSCGNQTQQSSPAGFNDGVTAAFAQGGRIDLNTLQWTREPGAYAINGDTLTITTAPHTDLWQRTYYHFRNDNAPVFQMETCQPATNNGYSDWATTAIPADVKTMWYRFSRRADDYCIECSGDGVNFSQMRICHMYSGADKIRFGVYACSPEESSFTAVFTDMKITECMWKAHDGQQPD